MSILPRQSDSAENVVSHFYNNRGWKIRDGITEDAKRFEDLRSVASDYVSRCRLRVLRHIPDTGESIIDMASGPIQYPEYLHYSSGFKKRYCVDLSQDALDMAKDLIGSHGEFLHGSFFDIDLSDNFFDCAISLHTIYHIDKDKQEEAVRKLVRIVKKGKPVVIVYSNPNSFYSNPNSFLRKLVKMIKRLLQYPVMVQSSEQNLYFYRHDLFWWERFHDEVDVKILPWRTFGTEMQKRIFPDNYVGKIMFKVLFFLEDLLPKFFIKVGVYPMIILTKK